MKRIAILLLLCLCMTACADRQQQSSSQPDAGENPSSSQVSSSEPGVPDAQHLYEIICLFGAEQRITYDPQGQPVEADPVEYQTSVISFYYHEEGIPHAEEITPYGFFGWYLEYSFTQEEAIRKLLPDFERMVVVKENAISGEIPGAPADAYEKIVTSFFDVEVEQLRGDELYDAETHAYIPATGPGRGDQPTLRITGAQREGDLITMDIQVAGKYTPAYTLTLTVREDESNQLAGIRFVSLLAKPEE